MAQFTTTAFSSSSQKVCLWADGRALSFRDMLTRLKADAEFSWAWTDCLAAAPFAGFCWEMPPLTATTIDRGFECALVESPALARVAQDPEPFAEHFSATGQQSTIAFDNLGRDATLIAPCPRSREIDYAHLASFLRSADRQSSRDLWQLVARTFEQSLGDKPLWLSTAGLGVYWLHVRIDRFPKYYRHRVYADAGYWK
jgi:hypothetical protein